MRFSVETSCKILYGSDGTFESVEVSPRLGFPFKVGRSLTREVFTDWANFGTKVPKVASLARCCLFCVARMLDLLKRWQLARCLLRPRLSVVFSQEQPRAPQDTIANNRSRIEKDSNSRMNTNC